MKQQDHHIYPVHHFPLCIDLDGTLIRTDLLYECFKLAIKTNILSIMPMLFWLIKGGRPCLKTELALRYIDKINYQDLPYQKDLIDWLKEQKQLKKEIILVTGSSLLLARKIADEVKVFDAVYGTEKGRNLTGKTKACFLQSLYPKGYLYAGNELKDIHVWKGSGYAIFVNLSDKNRERALKEHIIPVKTFKNCKKNRSSVF